MRQKPGTRKNRGEKVVKDIRRANRKQYSAEEKIRIVLDGLKGEDSIAELCRREGIAPSLYYSWSKKFLEVGKKRPVGDTARAATSTEVKVTFPPTPGPLRTGIFHLGMDEGGRPMKRKRFTEEQIIAVLKEDGGVAKTDGSCRRHGISSATFYSWRNKYGGRDAFEAKRQRELEIGNAKLMRMVPDMILDMFSMKERLAKNWRYSLSSAKLPPC